MRRTLVFLAACSILSPFSVSGQAPTDGLIAYYPFSGNANDESGNGHHGTVTGAALTVDRLGNADSAYLFDGTAYIETPLELILDTTDDITISFWIRCDPGCIGREIMGFERRLGQELVFRMTTAESVGGSGLGEVSFKFRDDDWNSSGAFSSTLIADGNWHLVTGIRDTGQDELRIYVDGVFDSSINDDTQVVTNVSQTREFAIGANNHSHKDFFNPFIGALDEVRIYGRVLTEEEIQALRCGQPVITSLNLPLDPQPLGAVTEGTATFNNDIGGTHTASWDWGDGSVSSGLVDESQGTVSGSHTYSGPGIYTVTLSLVEETCGAVAEATFEYVVIYDSEGGFVTGGGWIDSPPGVYAADPGLTGKASFGFVAKYKKGQSTPDGNTQFQFKAGDLSFYSTAYDWLVVAGQKGKFKGEGIINGAGEYGFMLTAADGDPDLFCIKIWDKANGDAVVYDNQMGAGDDSDAGTALGGGSIKIHDGKNNARMAAGTDELPGASPLAVESHPVAYALEGAYPNPFNPQTTIRFSVPEAMHVKLVVFDVLGREVRVLVDGIREAGMHEEVFEADDLPSGTYLYRLESPQGSFVQMMRLVK